MKKTVSLILALMLALSIFAGCNKGKKIDIPASTPDTTTSASATPDTTTPASATPDASASISPSPETSAPVASPAPSSSAAPSAEFALGTWDGRKYSSQFSGISCTVPDDYTIAGEDYLNQLMGLASDALGTDLTEIAKLTTVYDAMFHDDIGNSVIVMYENLAISGSLKFTAEDYANVLKNQLSTMTTSANGVSYTLSDLKTRTFCGEDYVTLEATASTGVVQRYLCRHVGDYMACVIISGISVDKLDNLEACFG